MARITGLLINPLSIPLLALIFYALTLLNGFGGAARSATLGAVLAILLLPVLLATVFNAVHHAEHIAHQTGEPYGTLILTAAVTIIEVALIAFLMIGDISNTTLARDTVFSVIMIVCNGLVGLCIILGGIRYREQGFRTRGTSAYLTVLAVLATLTLIVPNYTQTTASPTFSAVQLAFVSIVTIILYLAFLYIQTVRHRDHFLEQHYEEPDAEGGTMDTRAVLRGSVLLVLSLLAVILLSKTFAKGVEIGLDAVGAPPALAGVIVALLVLLPESVAAVKAARRDELQKSVNLALGSSLATIGLTIPSVAVVATLLDTQVVLGISHRDVVLLVLTLFVSHLTFGAGRTNILNGLVHLVIFASFLLFIFLP